MDDRYNTITITNVGPSTDPLCNKVGRGVFNFDSFLNYLSQPIENFIIELTIDLSRVGWIALFDWWAFTCILHAQIVTNPQLRIRLDFLNDNINGIIPYNECADYFAGLIRLPRFSDIDYCQSYAVHRVLNFVKSLEGPSGFENVARGQIVLAGLTGAEAARPGWYRKNLDVDKSIILPRTSVEAKEMCLKFASRSQIEIWREAMVAKRVPNAAIFQSEEFWRILCHELARNVVEHAKGPGFITGRVVLPIESKLPRWCYDVYDKNTLQQLESTKEHGFVELCVSDAGFGIPATIEKSYRNRYKDRHGRELLIANIAHSDLIKFAFDELGTCKDADHSWITDRHALGHMLFIIKKYGGILSVFSGSAALTYAAGSKTFKRCVTQLGFDPQNARDDVNPAIIGTHIHLIIPLKPQNINNSNDRSAFYSNIPSSFHIDYNHPVGPLIPVRDKLGSLSRNIEGDDVIKFKEACKALAGELLQTNHTRNEMLVFDFSEVDWSPAQFETFLYLHQNVFINRIVLFTQVTRDFAELINAQEDEDRPTYLSDFMREDKRKRELDREFNEGRFLETYSALGGALVLALGPDRGEFLFGVRGKGLRDALLELIHGEKQTIQGLCLSHKLEEYLLITALHSASQLFRCDDLKRWGSVFVCGDPDRDDLEVQRLRAITTHFDIVVEHCSAWRGNRSSQSSHDPSLKNERFYLPTEDAIYTEFFETSRILARDRYVIEIAERLIYRICLGLEARTINKLNLKDVDILACSTTPTVLLAEAIRRAWPVELDGNRPVVIDYGPSMFSGADPAHIPISEEGNPKPHAIIIQDLFDEGTLSKKIITLVEKQGVDVLLVLSFIRFIDPDVCIDYKSKPFPPNSDWDNDHPIVGKPVHAMIGLARPKKQTRKSVNNWGDDQNSCDYVVDPRSLRPVSLQSLRLESGYSDERSLTRRDPCLRELDMDGGVCRLAAGHFVYGNRHFAVVADVRGILTGAIGYKIINLLADLCCDCKDSQVNKANNLQNNFDGEVTAILLPLHSQIHYILPGLQMELAQRGWRVPHFFLDATSFGGGVEIYDIPYQLQDQIDKANADIKAIMHGLGSRDDKLKRAKEKQLRLLLIDDAIFSGRTIQTVLDSLAKHVKKSILKVYKEQNNALGPINWIQAFAILNELPAAKSALWHQLKSCSASALFKFDEYAPFIGVATFSAADCPACRELEQFDNLDQRIRYVRATDAARWIQERTEVLAPLTTEAPSFRTSSSPTLPEPIDVLAISGEGAPERYKPMHADSAIWRFYELNYLSYPLDDVLSCLKTSRKSGVDHKSFQNEYARFRLAIYDWCVQNWHQVCLYHAEEQVLGELKAEIEGNIPIFVDVIHRLSTIIQQESVRNFVEWSIDFLAENDADPNKAASDTTLKLDIALTLFFFALRHEDIERTRLLDYLEKKQACAHRKAGFINILYRRLTQPTHVADPCWALTTIAETCFRGYIGNSPQERIMSDHRLLGRLVDDTAQNPANTELRRRLEGCLHAFVAASKNLQPYFDDDILSAIVSPANKVLEWLKSCPPMEHEENNSLYDLKISMRDPESWMKFTENCHMASKDLSDALLKCREDLIKYDDIYKTVQLLVTVSPDVCDWCLMTHIPRLIACISNFALEPAKNIHPTSPSRVNINSCLSEQAPSLIIEVSTSFGPASTAYASVNKSAKILHSLNDLREFGIEINIDKKANEELQFSITVPVGFQPIGGKNGISSTLC